MSTQVVVAVVSAVVALAHKDTRPRIFAQPAVNALGGHGLDGSNPLPINLAIVKGLAMANWENGPH